MTPEEDSFDLISRLSGLDIGSGPALPGPLSSEGRAPSGVGRSLAGYNGDTFQNPIIAGTTRSAFLGDGATPPINPVGSMHGGGAHGSMLQYSAVRRYPQHNYMGVHNLHAARTINPYGHVEGSVMRGSLPSDLATPGAQSRRQDARSMQYPTCDLTFIYDGAFDSSGCRVLRRLLDRPENVADVYRAVIGRAAALVVHRYGKHFMQKLLDVCTEEQRLGIVLVLTDNRDHFVNISRNVHGKTFVQKLIETLKTKLEIALVVSAVAERLLILSQHPNGKLVVRRCLTCFPREDTKLIIDATTRHCMDLAIHCHGCLILQQCIKLSFGEHHPNLTTIVSENALYLACHAFGNYVVQCVLDFGSTLDIAICMSKFEGHYMSLSTQKIGSHVVQKCLKVYEEHGRSIIIHELLSVPQFDQLLRDPFANYVIQTAIEKSQGYALCGILKDAIRVHAHSLRTCPFRKKLLSMLR